MPAAGTSEHLGTVTGKSLRALTRLRAQPVFRYRGCLLRQRVVRAQARRERGRRAPGGIAGGPHIAATAVGGSEHQ